MDPITIATLLGKVGSVILDRFNEPDIRAKAGELIDLGNDLTAMIADEAATARINEDLTARVLGADATAIKDKNLDRIKGADQNRIS